MARTRPPLTRDVLEEAFRALDSRLERPFALVLGGGTAMMLAHHLPVRTTDVDAYPAKGRLEDIAPQVREVGRLLGLAPDWLNPHFETFAHVLPRDYARRLRQVFGGRRLRVMALGAEDLLVMKCFAGREKDVGHARALLRKSGDPGIAERRIEELVEKGVPGAQDAADFFDDLREGA